MWGAKSFNNAIFIQCDVTFCFARMYVNHFNGFEFYTQNERKKKKKFISRCLYVSNVNTLDVFETKDILFSILMLGEKDIFPVKPFWLRRHTQHLILITLYRKGFFFTSPFSSSSSSSAMVYENLRFSKGIIERKTEDVKGKKEIALYLCIFVKHGFKFLYRFI